MKFTLRKTPKARFLQEPSDPADPRNIAERAREWASLHTMFLVTRARVAIGATFMYPFPTPDGRGVQIVHFERNSASMQAVTFTCPGHRDRWSLSFEMRTQVYVSTPNVVVPLDDQRVELAQLAFQLGVGANRVTGPSYRVRGPNNVGEWVEDYLYIAGMGDRGYERVPMPASLRAMVERDHRTVDLTVEDPRLTGSAQLLLAYQRSRGNAP